MSTDSAEVGRRIAALRQRLGLSQVAFARQVGTSRNALMAYERGGRMPKSATLGAEAGGRLGRLAPRSRRRQLQAE